MKPLVNPGRDSGEPVPSAWTNAGPFTGPAVNLPAFETGGRNHMLATGLTSSQSQRVTRERTAAAVGSGLLPVYATPAMIALMEKTASESVAPFLAAGETSVGTAIEVKHLAATPEGAAVRCQSVLTAIDGHRLTFEISVFDEVELVGTATHQRFIVTTERFLKKVGLKSAGLSRR